MITDTEIEKAFREMQMQSMGCSMSPQNDDYGISLGNFKRGFTAGTQ